LPLTALAALVESRQVASTDDEFSGTARTRETDAERVDENRRQEQRRVLNDALAALTRAGAKLKPITLPDIPAAALYAILNAEAGAAFDDLVRAGRVGELTGKGRTIARISSACRPSFQRSNTSARSARARSSASGWTT